ncbi:hypothetical protein D3C87_2088080 [compost metagenome]
MGWDISTVYVGVARFAGAGLREGPTSLRPPQASVEARPACDPLASRHVIPIPTTVAINPTRNTLS